MMTTLDIREHVDTEVFDYQRLTSLLSGYAKPRDRISALLADGGIVRLRKGLYTFGGRYRHTPLHRCIAANLIYGPSYVSLDYALARYGMIPERIENVTSVTMGQNRRFATPVGVFSYQRLAVSRYSIGMQWIQEEAGAFLMASPEKALVDKVWFDRWFRPARLGDFDDYLFDDLRLNADRLCELDMAALGDIARIFRSRKITMLARFLAHNIGEKQ